MTAKELAEALKPYHDAAGLSLHRYPCKAVAYHQIEGKYRARKPPNYKEFEPCTCGFDDLMGRALVT